MNFSALANAHRDVIRLERLGRRHSGPATDVCPSIVGSECSLLPPHALLVRRSHFHLPREPVNGLLQADLKGPGDVFRRQPP